MKVKISDLTIDKNQPRKKFEDIDNLAENIKREGILYPLLVDKDHKIIDGERRYRAAKKAGLKEVPVIFLNMPVNKSKRRLLAQCFLDATHQNLGIAERDKAWYRLYKEMGEPTKRDFAKHLGVSEDVVSDSLERVNFLNELDSERISTNNLNNYTGTSITKTKAIKDSKVRAKVIEKMESEGLKDNLARTSYVKRVKRAIDEGNVETVLKDPITNQTKIADRLISNIQYIVKHLQEGLMTSISAQQGLILSGYISELHNHLHKFEKQTSDSKAQEGEIVK